MKKIKKQKDRYYYERIVTWRKKPKYSYIFGGLLCVILFFLGMFFIIVQSNYVPDNELMINENIPMFWRLIFILLMICGIIGSLFFGLFLIFENFGEGKKIKFKRIGK